MSFIISNLGTIIAGLAVLVAAIFAVRHSVKAAQSGGCGCGCDSCPSSGLCHEKEKK